MKSLRLILMFALFILVGSLPSGAESMIKASMTIRSIEKDSGRERWTSRIDGQFFRHQGQTLVYYIETGKDSKEEGSSWTSSSYSIVKGRAILPYLVSQVIRNRNGSIVGKVEKFFDLEKRKVLCVINGKTREFDYQDNMIDKQNIAIALMNYPFGEKAVVTYRLLTHEPNEYEIYVKARGKELVKGVECYKLEIVFNLGALNIFEMFIPKFYVWYEGKAPHLFVKYEGLESGMGTPYVVVERTN